MLARLWWKETRQVWPIWALLAASGLAVQAFVGAYWGQEANPTGYLQIARVVTLMYLFLIAAAVFAGERESGTLGLLDAIPIERGKVWIAKAAFSLVTTALLMLPLWAATLLYGALPQDWTQSGLTTALWGVLGLGWGLFWSSFLANALSAAVLAMISWSVTLLLLVNLNSDSTAVQSVPSILLTSLLATAASALIFRLGGPPQREPRRRAGRPTAARRPAIAPEIGSTPAPQLRRIWTYSVPSIAWQTLREVRANGWMLAALTLGGALLPIAVAWNNVNQGTESAPMAGLGAVALAIVCGVAVFNAEHRGGTNRFLLRHGARPGVVWTIKVAIWGAVTLGLWAIVFSPVWHRAWQQSSPAGVGQVVSFLYWFACGLFIAFAVGLVSGMAFRRGIMAGTIALVVCFAFAIGLGALIGSQVLYPWHLPYVAGALLAVSWAWSGDWLLDRPGPGRWARLGLYSAAALATLTLAYLADRSWLVPTLPAAEAAKLFETNRIAASVPPDENAAPLYHEAVQQGLPGIPEPASSQGKRADDGDPRMLLTRELDFSAPEWENWRRYVEPRLAILRRAARLPACQFDDLRKVTALRLASEPPVQVLVEALAGSARLRLDRGDLDGSWEEIETILRMARQWSFSHSVSFSYLEQNGLALARIWAADPRQTVESLEKGRKAWMAIPEPASKADRIRIESLLFRNMLQLKPDEIADGLFFNETGGRKRISAQARLTYDLQTTSWEIDRARKVFDLLSARMIEYASKSPVSPVFLRGWPWTSYDPRGWQGGVHDPSTDPLALLVTTTPLLRQSALGWYAEIQGRDEMARRATGLILRLRIFQARHDGALPRALNELPLEEDEEGQPIGRDVSDLKDPYASDTKPFGYVASEGQSLLPLGSTDPIVYGATSLRSMTPTPGCMLLYSIGPDGVDDRAVRNVDTSQKGDYVYPIKDGVKPPQPATP